ncbi:MULTISPECIES: CdaR family transcriptional regulator [Terrabacteria group]|uniref:PucR family transcriptional regulator n=1 Tax=Bacillati TaxID=1783272 RepID=UPI00193A27A1|nr:MULTISPECIES: PucR family transcriptional regulator [Terrabacteria group]MBW9212594.1 helix-turn-helix domain-containing protein [Trueperella sp. zg.1013]QRG86911.1 helix-turn-helix domain-containing protein [Bulleidia sp. zg-1006]
MDVFELVYQCETLEAYINAVAKEIQCPMWLMDEYFQVLAISNYKNASQYLKRIQESATWLEVLDQWNNTLSNRSLEEEYQSFEDYFFHVQTYALDVRQGKKRIGRLTIMNVDGVPIPSSVLKQIVQGASIYLRKQKEQLPFSSKEYYLYQLLHRSSDVTPNKLPWHRSYRLWLVEMVENNSNAQAYLWNWLKQIPEPKIAYVQQEQALILSNQSIVLEKEMISGSSFYYDDLQYLPEAYQQASFALSKRKHILHFEDVYWEFIYQSLNEKYNGQAFILPSLWRMKHYDNQYHSDYCQTLEAYIQGNYSKSECARLLKLHLNTVKYRFKQMEELFGLDLKKEEPLLELSLRFMHYQEKNQDD